MQPWNLAGIPALGQAEQYCTVYTQLFVPLASGQVWRFSVTQRRPMQAQWHTKSPPFRTFWDPSKIKIEIICQSKEDNLEKLDGRSNLVSTVKRNFYQNKILNDWSILFQSLFVVNWTRLTPKANCIVSEHVILKNIKRK